ncbi:2-dehydropantoate 2-reductase [Thermaerobacter marianensis DSM 12885]|uniref:2-dehydropantoate 2-reductase n=1 Tax=Thermaerobacter marianensis (strain ATCC 700841 / DSM 12885 / JCM 10246 / 7p75a) TaxID=644966 RepID=E6SMA5_THEM7|nr:2-dehydropantoate 2-reductase [Thermaerobacter marianensis]ADU51464.1 2-dehydropantoate 2-reductase [Thermaerobacter marianensis DSM 12885]
MRIAVIGAGGVGGYFGALLARAAQWAEPGTALHGARVGFLARGRHLRVMRRNGLQVESVHGRFSIKPVASDRGLRLAEELALPPGQGADLVLLTVKAYSLPGVLEEMEALVGGATAILPLMNGIDHLEVLKERFGGERVLGGLCHIQTSLVEPGKIRQTSARRDITFGELDGRVTPRVERIAAAFAAAGIPHRVSDRILADMWMKLIFISAMGGLTAAANRPLGAVLGDPDGRQVYERMVREAVAVARAAGVDLPPDAVDQVMATTLGMDPAMTSSMQRDLAARRPVEVDALCGAVVRYGQRYGVDTPCQQAVTAAIRLRAGGEG